MEAETAAMLASTEKCTGCGACVSVCPAAAIQMTKDSLGFLTPQIDHAICMQCGKCTESCPVCSPLQLDVCNQSCYAAQAEDTIRRVSTSGGIFTLLAESVITSGGVVFGVEIDEKLHVHHISVDDVNQLFRLRGSKYVQSDPRNTYLEAKAVLEEGRTVLYSGCPCQIAALRKVLGKDYPNLYTVDLLCLGVPSPMLFEEYVSQFSKRGIDTLSFRDKTHGRGWSCDSMYIRTKDGGEYHYSIANSSFEACFHKKIFLRESCYDCAHNNLSRVGDITLGDFWQIEEYDPSLNDNIGTSMVLVNSAKGAKLFADIRERLIRLEEVPPQVSRANRLLEKSLEKPLARERFLELYQKYGYEKAAEYAGFGKYDVGIVGCWSVENHGSNMTYYALYQTILDMGLEPLMIERPGDAPWKPNESPTGFSRSPYRPWDLATILADRNEMRKLNNQCDTFLLGSDQLFYHDLYASLGEFADLGYIDSSKRKIAYAASVGRSHFAGTQQQRAKLSYYLRRFHAVSVREKDAVPLFGDTFGVDAQHVLDPVFLCQRKYYDEMADRGRFVSAQPYIAVYILDPSPEKEAFLNVASQELGIPLRIFSDVARNQDQIQKIWTLPSDTTATNEDWLRALRDSQFIITDSFHGTCFAIIFQKPFLSIANPYRGRSRFTSLLQSLGLEHRMVEDLCDSNAKAVIREPLDYQAVQVALQPEICRSRQWLEQALQCSHDPAVSGFDILSEKMAPLEQTLREAQGRSLTNEHWLLNTHHRVEALEPWLSNTHMRVEAMEPGVQETARRLDTLEPWLSNTHMRVEAIEPGVQETARRLDALEPWLSNTHMRVEAMEPGVQETARRLDALEPWLSNTHMRVEAMEPGVQETARRLDALEPWLSNTHMRVELLEHSVQESSRRVDALEQEINGLHEKLLCITKRIDALEQQTLWSVIKNSILRLIKRIKKKS